MSRIVAYDRPPLVSREELLNLVGGKAANLTLMAVDLALPVPPAFTITTDTCREHLASGWPRGLDQELREQMTTLEQSVGRRFGGPGDPLLVSVRSGAPVSMPGMMDTILNVGLTSATADGFAPDMAAALRARLEASLHDVGVAHVPEDPWAQLRAAIEAVFRSWQSPRAVAYRRREGISDELGTAVTVQAMVFGNRGDRSATGVLFTRNPATGENRLYGDVLFDAQGEDVVAGTHATEPIDVLDERLPAVAAELRAYASQIEHRLRDVADIEFTIEDGRLWMLQCRVGKRSPQAALRVALEMALDPDFPLSREEAVRRVAATLADPPRVGARALDAGAPLTVGLGASPGLASGEIVMTPDEAVAAADGGRTVILVRRETSPDDVHGMARAAGILTATGGLASHAAVVARGWGIPAVVGAMSVIVAHDGISIGDRTLAAGDAITIDGSTGEVFAGIHAGSGDPVPEAATLLEWAHELGIPIGSQEPTPTTDEDARAVQPADLQRLLLVKGYATPEAAAEILAATPDTMRAQLDELVASGNAEPAAGAFRLTAAGKEAARGSVDAERREWGESKAEAALDAFIELDCRVKETVTSWQMREGDGAQQVNNHSDAAYDGAVLARLGGLHGEVAEWLDGQAHALGRLAGYRRRLDRAMSAVSSGDHRFVASPRVDSYHSVWFELHEELILLAGRSRAEEVAAGRA